MQNEQVLSKIEELKSMFTDALNSLASELSGGESETEEPVEDVLGGSKEASAQLTPEEKESEESEQPEPDMGNSPAAAFMRGNMAKKKMI